MANCNNVMRESLLQEGVSTARAILFAVQASDMFRDLPADQDAADRHNHGLWLLGMLEDHLDKVQAQVNDLDVTPVLPRREG